MELSTNTSISTVFNIYLPSIFCHLPFKDLIQCALISKSFRKVATSNHIWTGTYRLFFEQSATDTDVYHICIKIIRELYITDIHCKKINQYNLFQFVHYLVQMIRKEANHIFNLDNQMSIDALIPLVKKLSQYEIINNQRLFIKKIISHDAIWHFTLCVDELGYQINFAGTIGQIFSQDCPYLFLWVSKFLESVPSLSYDVVNQLETFLCQNKSSRIGEYMNLMESFFQKYNRGYKSVHLRKALETANIHAVRYLTKVKKIKINNKTYQNAISKAISKEISPELIKECQKQVKTKYIK